MAIKDILKETDLTQDIKAGDTIIHQATGYLREVRVTKVTPTYVWVEYTSPSTGMYHNSKFRRREPCRTSKPRAESEPGIKSKPCVESEPISESNPEFKSEPGYTSKPSRGSEPQKVSKPYQTSEL